MVCETWRVARSSVYGLRTRLGNPPESDRYVTPSERERFLGLLLRDAHLIEITESIRACRDPKDDQVLELAVCGRADWIMTGMPTFSCWALSVASDRNAHRLPWVRGSIAVLIRPYGDFVGSNRHGPPAIRPDAECTQMLANLRLFRANGL